VRQILVDLRDLLMRHPSTQGNDLIIRDLENDVVAEINGTDLLQILLNMTFNALQCTERPHRVEVEAHRLNAPFNVGAVRDGVQERLINGDVFANRPPLLAITVKDNGPGIAPDVMPKLFEQAFTTKTAERGTGLGLSIVKRDIREASGAVHLQTELGGGSQFTLLLQAREG
jgi:signal transduction histidine kinase